MDHQKILGTGMDHQKILGTGMDEATEIQISTIGAWIN
jgi:hypothetical protein